MRFDMGTVEHQFIRDCSCRCHFGEDPLPDATVSPTGIAIVNRLGRAVLGRDIAPARARLEDVENAADHASIIDARSARLVVRQMGFKTRPGVVRQPIEIVHGVLHAPATHTSSESLNLGNCLVGSPT